MPFVILTWDRPVTGFSVIEEPDPRPGGNRLSRRPSLPSPWVSDDEMGTFADLLDYSKLCIWTIVHKRGNHLLIDIDS